MALAHSPRIVRDNLVLYLDAANTKSYPGSGTTWKDISGKGHHGTLINGTIFNSNENSMDFDGTNDQISSGLSGGPLNTSYTYIIWFNLIKEQEVLVVEGKIYYMASIMPDRILHLIEKVMVNGVIISLKEVVVLIT